MSAFKVLNLRQISSRVILILMFLSLGLISLVFSGINASPLFELALIISYAAFGDFFLSAYLLKGKEHRLITALSALIFLLELAFNFTCFRLSLKALSVAVISLCILSGALLSRLLIKKSKGAAFKLLPHLLLMLYALFFIVL